MLFAVSCPFSVFLLQVLLNTSMNDEGVDMLGWQCARQLLAVIGHNVDCLYFKGHKGYHKAFVDVCRVSDRVEARKAL